jgi:hypothetical protein
MLDTHGAYGFLKRLEGALNESLPRPATIQADIARRSAIPRAQRPAIDRLACNENLFLYHHALPIIFDHLITREETSPNEARASLRGEYHAKFPGLLSGNAYRAQGHPFGKDLRKSPAEIASSWRTRATGLPINQAFPDLCITSPSPHRVVFDAKLLRQDSVAAAEEALVMGVYETMFYRGLPAKGWGYDYGCLLAYDASVDGVLQKAWNAVAVKRLFWEDAQVFVMAVRGQS